VEAGYDTNVFYSDASAKQGSPILRVTPFLGLTNATRNGAVPSGVYYDLGAALTYREYLSDVQAIKDQRAFNPSAYGTAEFSSGRTFTLGLSDAFAKTEEPPYIAGEESINRVNNVASLTLRFSPGGGRLRGFVRYANSLDIFPEGSNPPGYANASSMGNDLTLDGSWLWLPKTALFVQLSQGFVYYFDPDLGMGRTPKSNSFPLRTLAGLRGLLTPKLSLQIAAGYANGFYESGPNTSGIGNVNALAEIQFRPTLLTGVSLGYQRQFRNSVLGNFYDLDGVYLGLTQRVADRINLAGYGRYEFRRYKGVGLTRTDSFAQAGAMADYFIQEWLYAGAAYALMYNSSDLSAAEGGIDYVKQYVFFRLGVIY
jgi:hypothetical protein